VSVNSVHLFPKNSDHIVVCNKTSAMYIMTLQGQVCDQNPIVLFSFP
jgi:WD40 repeat-containing protein SMU1